MSIHRIGITAVGVALALSAGAQGQVWIDANADNTWSTNALNWDAGAEWINGSSAVFSGNGGTTAGETVDVSNAVAVANMTFQTNGYVVADADSNGTLTLVGAPSVITVVNAADTAVVSESLAGAGFTKMGAGLLQLKGANTYTGVTTVSSGTLRLNANTAAALGAGGSTNSQTVVLDGATLDIYSAYSANVSEDFVIKGSGAGGIGALVNNGPTPYYNVGIRNLTLAGDASIGGAQRFDLSGGGSYTGNGYTLTKVGSCETALTRAINGSPIVISAGTYTVQNAGALGTTDYPTTLNGGKLQAWGSYTNAEHIIINGGTISSSGDRINTFRLTGNITLNSNVVVQTDVSVTNTLELAGAMDGAGGFTRNGNGTVCVLSDDNTYTGPTINNTTLWVGGKTVGGTGKLGAGVATNNGTLYANSPSLGAGDVVNNNILYCSPPLLNTGRLINKGTVYGTSVLQTASGIVNSGTWQAYSGAFGSGVLTNTGTINLYTNVLTYGQFVNGGVLSLWTTMTLPDPITFNGGSVYVNDMSNSLSVTGPVTVNTTASFDGTGSSVTEVSGPISGAGGIIRSGAGYCYLTSDANTYAGPTVVNGGRSLYVGKAGALLTGRLGSGAITNNGTLYFDHAGSYEAPNGLNGSGVTLIRYGADVTVSGKVSTNSTLRIAQGSLSLTNGAVFCASGELTIADRQNVFYTVYPTNSPLLTNVTATVTVSDGCVLSANSITFGNGGDLPGGGMTGTLNQVGGVVRTTGATAEDNGVRLGHYPQTRSVYNMMGGSLFIEKNYDLGCATDGNGWFRQTGGEVYAKRVMLNERDNAGGYGRLTVSGGVLNVGSMTGSPVAVSNGIAADLFAPYLVEFGGAGGIVRAVTNVDISVSNVLAGAAAAAITFDTQAWRITMTNRVSGAGGFNKAGSGTLSLSANNTFTGEVSVQSGTLLLNAANTVSNAPVTVAPGAALDLGGYAQQLRGVAGGGVVSNGSLTVAGEISPGTNGIGELTFAIANAAPGGALVVEAATNGTCDVLHMAGSLSLDGMSLQVVDNGQLNTHCTYTIVRCDGALSARFSSVSVPQPWYVYYDWAGNAVRLQAARGTMIRLR